MIYKFFISGFLLLISINSVAQTDNYRIEDFLEEEKNGEEGYIHPSLYQRNSVGVVIVPYIGLGASYRLRSEKGLGFQTSVLNGWDHVSVELTGLYTLHVWTSKRMFFESLKDYNLFVFQGNYFHNKQSSHSLGLGLEAVHWRKLGVNLKVGGAFFDSSDELGVYMEYGLFYKF